MTIGQENIERFNEAAAAWDDDPERVNMAESVAQAMLTALSPSGSEQALEFGAGTGLVTLPMARKLGHVTAMDSSAGMLGVLRQKCAREKLEHVEILQGTIPKHLPDRKFDLIYSSMSMHHIEDVRGLLEVLADHVAAGGRVALADLDAEDGKFHDEGRGVAHHGFNRETFASWLSEAGFEDVTFSTAFTAHREHEDGSAHDYPVFLATARKPGM